MASSQDFLESPGRFAYKQLEKNHEMGLCGIKPPAEFSPVSNIIADSVNDFKLTNQYIHRMLQRWSPSTRGLTAIRFKQDPKIQRSPLFDG